MSYVVTTDHKAKSFDFRIRFLVLHYTAANFDISLKTLTQGDVSAHYLVPKGPMDGERKVYRLVSENLRAWHAGTSAWQNRTNLNDNSVGIEIVNLGYVDKQDKRQWFPFPDYQIETVIELSTDIINRYHIEPTRVVGHSDIAPNRKVDPGPLFPWKKLYEFGIGAWYNDDEKKAAEKEFAHSDIDILWLQKNLKTYGYSVEITGQLDQQTKHVITAFQMHFRSNNYSGIPDGETCAILQALVNKYYPQTKHDE